MPRVEDYTSGNILCLIKRGFRVFTFLDVPILGLISKIYGLKALKKCRPVKISVSDTVRLINASDKCAVGQRVCNELYHGADLGESVFLDELSEGMVKAGKAGFVSKEEAVDSIITNRKGPIILTKVSGKYMEICRSLPKNCIYWNSEKNGLKCIRRNLPGR